MRTLTIARNYAAALYELGARHDEAEDYAGAFDTLTAVLASEPRIRRFLETPKVEAKEKSAVVRQALEGRAPERFVRFVLVVLAKRRQALLPEIRDAYQELLDEHAGRIHARVTLAREPDEATRRLIAERLSGMLGKTVVPHIAVNPEILGGLVVRYGDRALDGSLRRQLVSLKREMMHAGLPELPALDA
ncbi:MAG: ATP synthase F1 subunit delta [Gemmatimonadetes bacterium]|nr:ATP synthase F1 subunit delta [Gemmatimonadota bacterium]NIW36660.1 ATP synthase F1 subunit delta [Gemmatimonadota bacterium]NIY12405.1 ATP synthase F1 subunit delta [Gemmatimonadota bacterium]